ncbi:hypothetical protein DSO57_1001552 [Entomophthora muscae]|uniref:Uncharacterized protein n=1 Tax=Entomophthora muscae TaxID=34485 RepID=A0ACC2RNY8_9FUNG|nr:hypothetical protein DSO57_1001552 [Entomophthora muscae]
MQLQYIGALALAGLAWCQSAPQILSVEAPALVLYGFNCTIDVTLIWGQAKDQTVSYKVLEGAEVSTAKTVSEGALFEDSNSDALDKDKVQVKGLINRGTFISGYRIHIHGDQLSNSLTRTLWVVIGQEGKKLSINGLPALVTLIPIVLMLGIALLSSQATLALLVGIFVSATLINGLNPIVGFLRTLDDYIINSLADPAHAMVIMFTFYLSAAVALVQKSGGAEALATSVTRFATTRWRGMWAAYLIGIAVFIDDLSSCMIVGANMRIVTDRLYLSHEKLAYIVHVTSPTVASLSPVSSWIGFMLGVIREQLNQTGGSKDPFMFFLRTIPSRFFPIFAIVFCGATMTTRRDFGGMLVAERRAFFDKIVVEDDPSLKDENFVDPLAPSPNTPRRLINSVIPILFIVVVTITSLLVSGYYSLKAEGVESFSLHDLAGSGDSYAALIYASFSCLFLCLFMYKAQGIIQFREGMDIIMYGVRDMVETMLILVFAWGVGKAFNRLHIDEFVVSSLSSRLPAGVIPVLCCILASIASFTTGTSWGTMGIMLPLAMPLAAAYIKGDDDTLMVHTASAVLSGALFGDMCSPIAATTLLTCAAVRIPIQHHVNTQLPYAFVSLFVACLFGYLPVGFGLYPDWAALIIGTVVLFAASYLLGVPTESNTPSRWTQLQAKFGKSSPEPDNSGNLEKFN